MLIAAFVVELVIMVGVPVAVAWWLLRRGARVMVLVAGAVTFVASQVVHIPLNLGLTVLVHQSWMPQVSEAAAPWFNGVLLGLTAGLCEEWARWATLRWWIRDARSWREAVDFGVGHGGCESLILAALVALNLLSMILLQIVEPTTLGVPPEAMGELDAQMSTFWAIAPHLPLLGGVERLMAMTLHVAAATLVMRAFEKGRLAWVWMAVLLHAFVDGVAVVGASELGLELTELLILGVTPLSVLVLWWTHRRATARLPAPPAS